VHTHNQKHARTHTESCPGLRRTSAIVHPSEKQVYEQQRRFVCSSREAGEGGGMYTHMNRNTHAHAHSLAQACAEHPQMRIHQNDKFISKSVHFCAAVARLGRRGVAFMQGMAGADVGHQAACHQADATTTGPSGKPCSVKCGSRGSRHGSRQCRGC
jgi:hypothetical protein